MSNDIYLVVGIIVAVLALPSVVSSLSDRRAPRAAAILILIGGGLIALAVTQQPGGYTLEEIPHVFARVIADIIN